MKKFIKLIALSLVLVMSVALLASCAAPNKDPDKAVEALKDNGYVAVKSDILGAAGLYALGVKDVDAVVTGTKTEDDKLETVTVIYFKDKDAANTAWEKVQDYAEDKKDDNTDWVVKKSGAMIYFGTKQAVKDAK